MGFSCKDQAEIHVIHAPHIHVVIIFIEASGQKLKYDIDEYVLWISSLIAKEKTDSEYQSVVPCARSWSMRVHFPVRTLPSPDGSGRCELLNPILDPADKILEIGIGREPGCGIFARVNYRCMIPVPEFSAD